MFFAYEPGANGKSVVLSTIAGIVGEYHRTAPIETFTATSGEPASDAPYRLPQGSPRTTTETEEGRRWADTKIKQLIGGNIVSARFDRRASRGCALWF